jgi:ribosomal-protein-alanine N-acetyltransferase
MNIPTITTSRLLLRPFCEEDAAPLHAILGEKDFLRFFPNPTPPPLERVEKYIEVQKQHWLDHGYGRWAVDTRDTGSMIGWNGLQYLPDTDEVEIGYILAKHQWNQGLTTEAAQEGLQFAFEIPDLEEVVAIIHPENLSSQRVAEKLGMQFTKQAEYFGMQAYRYAINHGNFMEGRD